MSRASRWCVTLCCRMLVIVRPLHLVVLVFEECLELRGGVLFFAVGCLLLVVRSLRLVILVFEECLELRGGVLLFAVGCLLLCDRYVWSYWFLTLLVVHAFCAASDCGFLAVNWAVRAIWKKIFPFSYFFVLSLLPGVLCFVDVLYLGFV